MLKLNYYIICFLSVFLLNSCTHEDEVIDSRKDNQRGGVLLTFDDDYVDEWFNANIKLKQYNWKGTFYITHFDKLSENQIRELNYLQHNGNEIAAHGLNHVHTTQFIKDFGENEFISKEINPMLTMMKNKGMNISDFSYPYGNRDERADQLLLNYFKTLRGTTYGNEAPIYQNCYYQNKSLFYGLGIDNSYAHFSVPYFISLLQYAKDNNRIVVFYAHKTVAKATKNYEAEFKTLEEICKFVKNNKMTFYTVSDLHSKSNKKWLN